MRTGGQLIVDCLETNGVERIYSVPGESYLAVLDAVRLEAVDDQLSACSHECFSSSARISAVCSPSRGDGRS